MADLRVDAWREDTQEITTPRHSYQIEVAGTLDTDNTTTLDVQTRSIAFHNMDSVVIENVGDTAVVHPRLVANDRGDWYTLGSMIDEATRGAADDQERILLIYQFMVRNHHHGIPLYSRTEELKACLYDPVVFMNSAGAALCGYSAVNGLQLMRAAGLDAQSHGLDPVIRGLHGHTVGAVGFQGRHQLMDMAARAYYLDRENRHPVSPDDLARDHDLGKRDLRGGPAAARRWRSAETGPAQYGRDDVTVPLIQRTGHRIDMVLRPGEKLVWRWDNIGKYSNDGRYDELPRILGNSRIEYAPQLAPERLPLWAETTAGLIAPSAEGAEVAASRPESSATWRVRVPYIICGGAVDARFIGREDGDAFSIALSLDGETWSPLWSAQGPGDHHAQVALDEHLPLREGPPDYEYLIRVGLSSASERHGANLAALKFTTDLMTSPMALPRLRVGDNAIVYTDDTEGARDVRVRFRWRESSAVQPPPPPTGALQPADGARVRDSIVTFRWPAVDGCDLYHLQVSRRADMRVIYRTSFDCYHEATEFALRSTGIFSPDEDYFWRVCARDARGVWGDWSAIARFRWEGPRVPVDLAVAPEDGGFRLSWRANPGGPRPVKYRLYASDERGFSANDQPHEVIGLGDLPANFVAETTETDMLVGGAGRCYWRVVAVDEHGTLSGPSDYAELPHPFIHTQAPAACQAGERYEYQPAAIRSLGDLQYRDRENPPAFYEREEHRWHIERGPAWLTIDEATGALTGTPPATDVGAHAITIAVTTHFPHEVTLEGRIGARFDATRPQPQTAAQTFTLQVR